MIKILTFCLSVMFILNIQADTTDSKWKNIIELKKTGDHCKDDANCFNRYHPAIEPRATAEAGDIIVLHTRDALDSNYSFDAVAEINQPIYSGGKISSQVKLARIERNNSIVRKRATLSELIVESNSIFISANIYSYLQDYADNLLEIILPFKEKMENRVMSGAIDPAEYAVFLARLNGFQSSIYRIEAMKKTYVANYEYFFKKEFIFNGFLMDRVTKNRYFSPLWKKGKGS